MCRNFAEKNELFYLIRIFVISIVVVVTLWLVTFSGLKKVEIIFVGDKYFYFKKVF